jgi:hypothetical protein
MEPLSPAFARLTNLQTRLREMPHFFETAVSVIPPTRSRTIAARSMFIGARPIRTPSSFALLMPAKTRSLIRSDSSSAIEPMSVRKSRPIGPRVNGIRETRGGFAKGEAVVVTGREGDSVKVMRRDGSDAVLPLQEMECFEVSRARSRLWGDSQYSAGVSPCGGRRGPRCALTMQAGTLA